MDNEFKLPFNFNKLLQHSDLIIALALLGTLLMMILPLPPFLMDMLLVSNITVAVAILLVSVYANVQARAGRKERALAVDRRARQLFPIAMLVALAFGAVRSILLVQA